MSLQHRYETSLAELKKSGIKTRSKDNAALVSESVSQARAWAAKSLAKLPSMDHDDMLALVFTASSTAAKFWPLLPGFFAEKAKSQFSGGVALATFFEQLRGGKL